VGVKMGLCLVVYVVIPILLFAMIHKSHRLERTAKSVIIISIIFTFTFVNLGILYFLDGQIDALSQK